MGCMASLDYAGKIDVGCIPIGKFDKHDYAYNCSKIFGVRSLKGWGRCAGLKIVQSCSCGGTSYSLVQIRLLYDVGYLLATIHTVTDRHTDRRTTLS